MSDRTAWIIAGIIFTLALMGGGLKAWTKIELCSTYYREMNQLACFMSDSTLPQRTNR
jgi:hypothetical protein